MGIADKLDDLMWSNKLNKNKLSKEVGIPYNTLNKIWETGGDNTKLSTLKKLADFFGVTLDYLADDECITMHIEHTAPKNDYYLDKEAAEIAEEIHKNTNLRALFDASRNVKKDDLQLVVDMINRLKT